MYEENKFKAYEENKQLAKDLALAYASVKLQSAVVNEGFLNASKAPPHIEELEYLLSEFQTAFDYYYIACGVSLDWGENQDE